MSANFIAIEIKTILLLTFLTCVFFAKSQSVQTKGPMLSSEYENFSLTLSTYNHAERIFKGKLTYILKDSSIRICRSEILSGKDSVIYSRKIGAKLIDQIRAIKLDTLQDYYYNKCIMGTSGTEYDISRTCNSVTKNIHLHHYYHKQVDQLIIFLNKLVPDKYKIEYLTPNIKQDCGL